MNIPTEAMAAMAAMGTFLVWIVKYMLKMFTDHMQNHDSRTAEAHTKQCAALDQIVMKLEALNGAEKRRGKGGTK